MVIVCADDFGQSAAISAGILQLVAKGRLQAVSCMVTETAFETYAKDLLAYQSDIQIGLHLNLTHGQTSLLKVIAQAYRLWPCSTAGLKRNIWQQLELFYQYFGRWPDFIDGHQHVHQLPLVAEALFQVLEELGIRPWLRQTYVWGSFPPKHFKKLALCVLGGHHFAKQIKKRGYPTNLHFAGDYAFSPNVNYREIFIQSLAQIKGEGLIMCHPGLESEDQDDPIYQTRALELDYFASKQYLKDIEQLAVSRLHLKD